MRGGGPADPIRALDMQDTAAAPVPEKEIQDIVIEYRTRPAAGGIARVPGIGLAPCVAIAGSDVHDPFASAGIVIVVIGEEQMQHVVEIDDPRCSEMGVGVGTVCRIRAVICVVPGIAVVGVEAGGDAGCGRLLDRLVHKKVLGKVCAYRTNVMQSAALRTQWRGEGRAFFGGIAAFTGAAARLLAVGEASGETGHGGFDLFQAEGFGDDVVHAGFEATVAVFGHHGRGEGDDRGFCLRARVVADDAGGFEAIHFGHIDVH